MTEKKKVDDKIPITVSVDQTILADFTAMVEQINIECECGVVHTVDDFVEVNMKSMLKHYHVSKIRAKYE